MKVYDVSDYAETFRCSENTAKVEISEIRSELKAKKFKLIAGRKVTDMMFFLTGRYDRLEPIVFAELKRAHAIEEMANAIKEKPLVASSDLENIINTL